MDTTTAAAATMPAPIAAAIVEIMGSIKSLPKSENNAHGGYAFASIDAFLAAVGPLCAGAGLIVLQDEESVEVFDRGGKGWLRITYAFTLAHSSGAIYERPMRRTVLQAIAGPQTTGGTQSYALKMFMRSLFQIPTGDMDDADYQPKTAMETRQDIQERNQPALRAPAPAKMLEAASAGSSGLQHIAIPKGDEGLQVGKWTRLALDALAEAPDQAWRLRWLEVHREELADVERLRPDYSAKVESIAKAPDIEAPAA